MTIEEALGILSLSPGATRGEVRRAYLALVKVWHPDRFTGDPELAARCGLQLQLLNEAFELLRDGIPAARRAPESSSRSTGARTETPSPSRESTAQPANASAKSPTSDQPKSPIWNFVRLMGTVIVLGGIRSACNSASDVRPSVSQNPIDSALTSTAYTQPGQQPGGTTAPSLAGSSRRGARDPLPTSLKGLEAPGLGAAEGAVPKLEDLDSSDHESIESTCYLTKSTAGPAAYHRCIDRNLAALRKAPSEIDLSTFSDDDRSHIESACYLIKETDGPAAYRTCVKSQIAALSHAPIMPDMDSLDESDRDSIQSSCYLAGASDGAAAYHRCVNRLFLQRKHK
jgi:hypothetical protein